MIAGEMRESGYYGNKEGYIATISETGDIVNEKRINPNNNTRLCILMPYNYGNAEYICIGSTDSIADTNTFSRIVFYGLDVEMNITWQKYYLFQKNYLISTWQNYVSKDSILYLMNGNKKLIQVLV
jgi:hypothetical protein